MYLAQWPCLRWILILHNAYAKEDCGLGEGTSPNRKKGIIHSSWELISLGDGWHKAVEKQRKQNTIFLTSCFMAPTYCSHILYLLTPVCFGKKLVPMMAIPAVTMREVGFSPDRYSEYCRVIINYWIPCMCASLWSDTMTAVYCHFIMASTCNSKSNIIICQMLVNKMALYISENLI